MKIKIWRRTAIALLMAALLFTTALPTQPASAEARLITANDSIEQQAQQFVDELIVQPHFASWKKASLHISPLGPGTHSWLVLVKQQKEVVGYLVIHATETGSYQLGEYGTGSNPLFDEETLQRSLTQLELLKPALLTEALYVHPLLAAWKVTAANQTYFTDAISGEELPAQQDDWLAASTLSLRLSAYKQARAGATLLKYVSLNSFNPYDKLPWLTKDPLQLSKDSFSPLFTKINSKEQLRYTAELFNQQMLYAWSVVGYNKWDSGNLYIALETNEEGTDRRYIPLLLLIELGHFYR